jgi:integrase
VATAKLTKRAIDALEPEGSTDYFVWDTALKGFGVRVSPKGRKVFVIKYRPRHQRRTKRITIGSYGVITVDQARDRAKRELGAITEGADPALTRRLDNTLPTVSELGTEFLAHVRVHRKPRTASEYDRLWRKHVEPTLGSMKVAAVTTTDVERLHNQLRTTPYVANRVVTLLGSFFAFAERKEVRRRHDRPVEGIQYFRETPRERFLTQEEFERLGDAIARAESEGLRPAPKDRKRPRSKATEKHRPKNWDVPKPAAPQAIAALRLLLLTGCRSGEILSLKWEDVDLDRGFLRLPDTKTGKSVRPLGQAAAALLRTLPRDPASPYVLPGKKPGTHFATIAHTWRAVRHAAELDGVRPHDLRHSFASVSALAGDPLAITRSLLGHKNIATTERYAHLSDDPVRQSADRTAGAISAWLNGTETAVTPIRKPLAP